MFDVNVAAVAQMTKMERIDAENMYLNLAYTYENEEIISGSRAMKRSPERIVMQRCGYSFAERRLVESFKELFDISNRIYKRTGLALIDSIGKKDMTPKNAYQVWYKLYRAIDAQKVRDKVAF